MKAKVIELILSLTLHKIINHLGYDYELSDIGLARGDIRDVAKAYYDEVVQERKVSSSAPVNPNLVGAV